MSDNAFKPPARKPNRKPLPTRKRKLTPAPAVDERQTPSKPKSLPAVGGRKRHRRGAVCTEIGAVRHPDEFRSGSDYRLVRVDVKGEPPHRTHLTPHAQDLFAEYMRRCAFFYAIEDDSIPIEFAGHAYLGQGKTRSYAIFKELRGTDGHGTPLDWFRAKARDGFASGKIGRGRATARSQLADRFFDILSTRGLEESKYQFSGRNRVDLAEVTECQQDPLEVHVLEYIVFSNLIFPGGDEDNE